MLLTQLNAARHFRLVSEGRTKKINKHKLQVEGDRIQPQFDTMTNKGKQAQRTRVDKLFKVKKHDYNSSTDDILKSNLENRIFQGRSPLINHLSRTAK